MDVKWTIFQEFIDQIFQHFSGTHFEIFQIRQKIGISRFVLQPGGLKIGMIPIKSG